MTVVNFFLIFIGGIITAVITDVIVKILPISDDLRFRITYNLKKMYKMIRNVNIKAAYTIKTQNLENKRISTEILANTIKTLLIQNDFQFIGESGGSLRFIYSYGKTDVDVLLSPSYFEFKETREKQAELLVSYVEANLQVRQLKYNQFDGNMLDLLQTHRKLETCLRDVVGEWISESLSLEIGRLYQFTGVLSDLKLSSLHGRIQEEHSIDLSEKRVTLYGPINQTLTSTLKKLITFYY